MREVGKGLLLAAFESLLECLCLPLVSSNFQFPLQYSSSIYRFSTRILGIGLALKQYENVDTHVW